MLKTEYVENFSDFYNKAEKYFKQHYEGCEEYRADNKDLNIDIAAFQRLIDAGAANFFILKEEEDIIGYINVSIAYSPLFSQAQATIDFLYILPEYRRSNYATQAIEEIEEELEREGLKDINIMLPNKDYSQSVANVLGYKKTSTVYTKYLGEK